MGITWRIRWVAETGSTNDDLVALASAGEASGSVLVADHQTAGRGRLDRTWEARPGDGLLMSVLLDAPARVGLVPSAVALAARAAAGHYRVDGAVELKWPNDLMARAERPPEREAGASKLAGILAVTVGDRVVVGMGLNVHGGPPGAAWLDDLAGRRTSRRALLDTFLADLGRRIEDWDGVALDYRRECATLGQRVSVQLSEETLVGVATDIDDLGCLVLQTGDGARRVLSVGDVTHLR